MSETMHNNSRIVISQAIYLDSGYIAGMTEPSWFSFSEEVYGI